ncbi:hypothetical protein FT643_11995 [Ketobacter sp. MCCC 1A13808]|uniref:hypothetical protein n=1 Tax=Ketobacter sp. MCCC 1A13808 TaxID=2602738 RepID=UPI0012EBAF9A|nr:hypothetical protein [Ketobacter sp. MCCC 1A13808]MVF12863.1 hypothetical protein [Ketobacter sp. MCCC 1A13808]
MKLSFFSRFSRKKRVTDHAPAQAATPEDIRRKLENYQKREGPANFGSAELYFVSEIDQEPEVEAGRLSSQREPEIES